VPGWEDRRVAYVLAALGGALGALARWGVTTALPHSPTGWPWATLLVNLTGCLLFGALLAVLTARSPEPPWARPFLAVGVLGGYTTYSAAARGGGCAGRRPAAAAGHPAGGPRRG
jgi:CrcB protein